jgi:hypothetical protein
VFASSVVDGAVGGMTDSSRGNHRSRAAGRSVYGVKTTLRGGSMTDPLWIGTIGGFAELSAPPPRTRGGVSRSFLRNRRGRVQPKGETRP